MKRIAAAALFCVLSVAALVAASSPARATCTAQGLINTCLDDKDAVADDGEEEAYERLDGGGYGGRPAEAKPGKTITVGDTTVTLGQTEEEDEPWQPIRNGEQPTAREDRARESANPLQFKCYSDGCY